MGLVDGTNLHLSDLGAGPDVHDLDAGLKRRAASRMCIVPLQFTSMSIMARASSFGCDV
jgi:hypothetical protein